MSSLLTFSSINIPSFLVVQQFLPFEMCYCELSMYVVCMFYDVIVKILSESQKRFNFQKVVELLKMMEIFAED